MTPRQREIYEAYQRLKSKVAVAKEFGIGESTVREALIRAERNMNADPGIREAMCETGLQDIDNLHSGWLKTDTASLYFQMPKEDVTARTIEDIKDAFSNIPPCPPLRGADHVSCDDTLTVYPIFDAHIGMRAWGEETGEDYDTDIAKARIIDGMMQCVAASPGGAEAIVLVGGDLLHANDNTNMTPASGHVLDVDTRHMRTLDVAISALATAIEMAAQKHKKVTVAVIPGNHDRDAYLSVLFALGERYRLEAKIDVQRKPGDFFVRDFGKVMIASHHGDKAKAERLVMHLADNWPEMWGRTRHRYYFTGHLHHAKVQDIGGVQVEQLRAVTAKDAYAASHAYSAKAEMQAITYHKERGEISRVRIAL